MSGPWNPADVSRTLKPKKTDNPTIFQELYDELTPERQNLWQVAAGLAKYETKYRPRRKPTGNSRPGRSGNPTTTPEA